MNRRLFTYKWAKIEEAERELLRWKGEESNWCYHLEDITRKRDGVGCPKHEYVNIGDILMATCNSCAHWEKNKDLEGE